MNTAATKAYNKARRELSMIANTATATMELMDAVSNVHPDALDALRLEIATQMYELHSALYDYRAFAQRE